MENFPQGEEANFNEQSEYDFENEIPPTPRPLGGQYSYAEQSPNEIFANKIEKLIDGATNLGDRVCLRIVRNYTAEDKVQLAYGFAQSIKTPHVRSRSLATFDPIIHDAPTSQLPMPIEDQPDYSQVTIMWMLHAERFGFYLPDKDVIDQLIDSNVAWGGMQKVERFNLINCVAAAAQDQPDKLLANELMMQLSDLRRDFPDAAGAGIIGRLLTKYYASHGQEDLAWQLSDRVVQMDTEMTEKYLDKFLCAREEHLAVRLLTQCEKGADAVRTLLARSWRQPELANDLLASALHNSSLSLKWRIDALEEACVTGLIAGKDQRPVQYKLSLLRQEFAQNRKYANPTDSRKTQG